ncbi:acyltransferase [Mesorhizobium caraganae]|uniref:acyltransferase n=1 Tax=Mesorhizobium caraganae TaxID=483206 RepID=UPI00193ADBC9|nr:acyltransferase [Mesorhizobium caraganae]MBM2716290.1 acyltransferase [Mesorhizobium caraganae]
MDRNDRRSKRCATLEPSYLSENELVDVGFSAVGKNVRIVDTCIVIGAKNVSIGNNVIIGANVIIGCSSGSIIIGDYVNIASGCCLSGDGTITLDDFSGLAPGVRIFSVTDDYMGNYLTNATIPREFVGLTFAPVHVGRHVIIGSGAVVLPGCNIGEGSSVGALSLVTKPLDSWGVFCGIPAKRLKARSKKLLELERQLLFTSAK